MSWTSMEKILTIALAIIGIPLGFLIWWPIGIVCLIATVVIISKGKKGEKEGSNK